MDESHGQRLCRTCSEFQIERIVFAATGIREGQQTCARIQITNRLHFVVGQTEIKYINIAFNAFFVCRLWNNDGAILMLHKTKKTNLIYWYIVDEWIRKCDVL